MVYGFKNLGGGGGGGGVVLNFVLFFFFLPVKEKQKDLSSS